MIIEKFKFRMYLDVTNKKYNLPHEQGVYIIFLTSPTSKRITYVGCTNNFSKRMSTHNKLAILRRFLNKDEKIEIGFLKDSYACGMIEKWLIQKCKPILNDFFKTKIFTVPCLYSLLEKEVDGSYNKFIVELYRHYQNFKHTNNKTDLEIALVMGNTYDPYFATFFNFNFQKVTDRKYLKLLSYINVSGQIIKEKKGKKYLIQPFNI